MPTCTAAIPLSSVTQLVVYGINALGKMSIFGKECSFVWSLGSQIHIPVFSGLRVVCFQFRQKPCFVCITYAIVMS